VAALLSGDVDMIDNPPIQDLPRLKQDPNVSVVQGLSNRVIYITVNQTPEGAGLQINGKNPLQDIRVREALSKAINRQAIVDRIMGGVAEPAAQLLANQFFGSNPDLQVVAYDFDGAKKLLAEAGYADGFELTLGTPNDRYINDAQVAQAVAQMWARLGVRTNVEASTATVFFANRNKMIYPAYLAGWGAGTNEMSSPLRSLVATRDPARGYGTTNFGGYSNPTMDELLTKALATVDDEQRDQLLQEASKVVIEDFGILPLHYEVTPWALRKGLTYEPRVDQYTLAQDVHPAN
jgi:peptide/nickel transport system substrate-binding protein